MGRARGPAWTASAQQRRYDQLAPSWVLSRFPEFAPLPERTGSRAEVERGASEVMYDGWDAAVRAAVVHNVHKDDLADESNWSTV